MQSLERDAVSLSLVAPTHARPWQATLPAFAATIFVSAFLLFVVQPMFTKMITPVLGGTPAVWSVAMVFFQGVLLAGYGYAYCLNRWASARVAVPIHILLTALVGWTALPIIFDPSWGRPPEQGELVWLLAVFAGSVGLPFFVLSANGPLLQAWFARTGHPHARDPYFLYGASNLGSFLALIAYPLLIEPGLSLKGQSASWSAGFGVLVLGLLASASFVLKAKGTDPRTGAAKTEVGTSLWSDRLAWVGLSFVPSGLLVATTAHISTDVAAVPLLWVGPLALFLLTFTLAFREGGERLNRALLAIQPAALAALFCAGAFGPLLPWTVVLTACLGYFFVSTMICHRDLYRRRPAASGLTGFYFLLSLGGVLGGVFATLIAPLIFSDIFEYHLLVLAALLCRPGLLRSLLSFGLPKVLGGVAALAAIGWAAAGRVDLAALPPTLGLCMVLAVIALLLISRESPVRLVVVGAAAVLLLVLASFSGDVIDRSRSFFAVHKVLQTPDGRGRLLAHGSTIHGAEWRTGPNGQAGRPEPVSYFHSGGVYAQAIQAIRHARGGRLSRVAVVGLGMGALACHSAPGEAWEFFEIDPEVVRIARDPNLFSSFTTCAPNAPVAIGDGRLTVAESAGSYDLIILDAFSSDAVPVHLLTTEAVEIYRRKLAPDGALLFNISNRHMALEGVVAGSAGANGFVTYHATDPASPRTAKGTLSTRAHVAVAARSAGDLGDLGPDWSRAAPPASGTWTDDYSNIVGPILRKR